MEELMGEYKARLQERISTTLRFSNEWRTPADKTTEILREAYRQRVASRGGEYTESAYLTRILEGVARWIAEGKTAGLFFNGGYGNGKTTLALAICDAMYCWGGISTRKISALNYMRAVAQQNPEAEGLARAKEVLFIDDIGTEAVSVKSYGTEYNPVVELLYTRYDLRRPTICTSNLTREQFNATYGPRVADRAKEMFDWVTFREGSFR